MGILEREAAGPRHEPREPARAESPRRCASRGLIILISDLLAPIDTLKTRLGYLRSRGHDVSSLRVLDPAEVKFTFQAPAMFHDVESGREV